MIRVSTRVSYVDNSWLTLSNKIEQGAHGMKRQVGSRGRVISGLKTRLGPELTHRPELGLGQRQVRLRLVVRGRVGLAQHLEHGPRLHGGQPSAPRQRRQRHAVSAPAARLEAQRTQARGQRRRRSRPQHEVLGVRRRYEGGWQGTSCRDACTVRRRCDWCSTDASRQTCFNVLIIPFKCLGIGRGDCRSGAGTAWTAGVRGKVKAR